MGRIDTLHNLLVSRKVSAEELTESYLKAIERDNPLLNAYVSVTAEKAYDEARRIDKKISAGESVPLLGGIPMSLKDNISTRNIETTCCSEMLRGYKPLYDATVWSRLESQGAVLLGKTNMDEFAMGSTSQTSCFGASRNPWDTDRSSGGSSGGSATAVSANLCAYSLGSDTGGSVRQPAAFCGMTGLKPTYGALSRRGLVAFASSLDQIGIIGETAEDVGAVFDAVAGGDPLDATTDKKFRADTLRGIAESIKGRKVGVVREISEYADEDVSSVFTDAIKVFESLGAEIVNLSLPEVKYSLPVYYILACAEASSNLARYDGVRYGYRTQSPYENIQEMISKSRSEAFGDEVKRRILMGTYVLSSGYRDAYYKKAQIMRKAVCGAFDRAFSSCDVILSPTTPTPAFRLDRIHTAPEEEYSADICTVPANIAGLPAVTFAGGYTPAGLPVGIQLIGNRFCENDIMNFAYMFQQETSLICVTDWGLKL